MAKSKDLKRVELMEGHEYVTKKSFELVLNDDKNLQFGIVFQTVDMWNATGDPEFKEYPFTVSASIVMDKCHRSFDESGMARPSKLSLLSDAMQYMGGIPIDHILTHDIIFSNEVRNKGYKGHQANFQTIVNQFNPNEAMVKSYTANFGTVAAQYGSGSMFNYMQFKDEAAALKFVNYLIDHRINSLSMMIGFILDRPINLAGITGWDMVNNMVKGCKR